MQIIKLYQELTHHAESIRTLVSGISMAEARFKHDAKSWSILEVICHLYDEEREDFRQRLDIILHRPTDKWPPIDPTGWVTARKYNERDLADMLAGFLAEREQSLAWLKGLAAPNWEATYNAPFGSIKAGDMLAAWVAHDTLHMRQLVELRYGRILTLTAPFSTRYAGDW